MPLRTCVGCRRKAPQSELVRVIRSGDGTLETGRTLPGRGAWLCAGSPACIDQAERRGAFQRALRGPVNDGSVESLRAALAGRARMATHADGPGAQRPTSPDVGTTR